MTPATPSPVSDPARLLADLAAARLVSADRGARHLAEFKQAGGHGSFLDHLLAAGVLTPFQAERAAAGQSATLLLGPYLLQEPVGTGSLGTVYRAVHRGDRRRVAVKVLPLRSLWNVLQAKKQVRTLAGLPPHPTVVPLADVDTVGQLHYLAWPFVEGETLESLVRRTGPLPPAHAARLAADVADGLALLHAHGLTHGLLKPANLLLGVDGRPRLLDLGMGAILADNIADGESMLDTISTANSAISSFDYAAPETILDPTCRTPAADVYALGCVLYCLLTGGPPFPDGNAVDKMLAHQMQPPPPVRDRSPLVPEPLADLVERLMQKDPADRPTDLPAVRVGLLAAAEEKPGGSGVVRTAATVRTPSAALDTDTPTDPPRAGGGPPAADRESGLDPVSQALSELRSKLAGGPGGFAARSDGEPDSINFDLPDPDGMPPGLPGLIDTGPPGMFAGRSAPDPVSVPPAASTLREPAGRPPAAPRKTPPPPVAATPAPAAPVTFHTASSPGPPSRREFALPPPPSAPAPATGSFGTAAAGLLRSIAQFANRVVPGLGGPLSDAVQVSVFGPKHLEPGKTVRLQVYAHPAEAFASVCTLSRALQPDSEVLAVGKLAQPVKRGQQVGLHLSVKNGGLARSLTAFSWQGKPKAEPFELHVPWESPSGQTPAALTVGVNNVQAGRFVFELTVRPRTG